MTSPLNPNPTTRLPQREIRVLVAEDSATVRWHLVNILNTSPGFRVIGEARNGEEVLSLTPQLKPDIISMDINMPRMDGLEATRRLMMEHPTPVVVVSSLIEQDVDLAFQALQAGALAVVEKPPDRQSPLFPEKYRQLIKTLMAMSSVKVIRRGRTTPLSAETLETSVAVVPSMRNAPEILALGASAGGPSAISTFLKLLPTDLPIPLVVVQHMPHEFIGGLARWLGKSSGWRVQVASDNAILMPGVVHLSPGTAHLTIMRRGKSLLTRLVSEQGSHRHQPAIDMLFYSIAEACGSAALGIVLTGMGDDGAAGLLAMRQVGARTFAQDKTSSTVFGMPNAAIERGAVEEVLPLTKLPTAILKYL